MRRRRLRILGERRHRPVGMARVTPGGRGHGQVTEIPGRGDQFWEFPGTELLQEFNQAGWLVPLLSHQGGQVRSWLPEIYPSYARVLYPIVRSHQLIDEQFVARNPPTLRWSEVAQLNGWQVHPEIMPRAVLRPAPGRPMAPPDVTSQDLRSTLESHQYRALASILSRHTSTPATTWFGVWEGYADLMVGYAPTPGRHDVHRVDEPKRFALPMRNYLIYQAPVTAWQQFRLAHHDAMPDLWWPEDRQWFVATDTDFEWLYVGGSADCIDELVRATEIEAIETRPEHSTFVDADLVNDPNRETVT